MKKITAKFKNEEGAITLEFLGILPFYFMFFLILWQVVASGYAIYIVKSAANEGAKTFAVTEDINEAEDTVKQAIGSSNVVSYENMNVVSLDSSGKFKLHVKVDHFLIFVPDRWKPSTSLSLEESTVSQVLVE